jgi:hypothetical protein
MTNTMNASASQKQFTEHAQVAEGASDLFARTGHVRLVYGVQSLPVGAPVGGDVIFEIRPES